MLHTFTLQILIPNEKSMLNFGKKLSKKLGHQAVIYFQGELGAGKTTLIRGILQGLGYKGRVKSPTYSLVESYLLNAIQVFHFDFYRLQDPIELEHIGIKDYFAQPALCLIEWPEQAGNFLPDPDLNCAIEVKDQGRNLNIEAYTERGKSFLESCT